MVTPVDIFTSLLQTYMAVPPARRFSARWVMNEATAETIRPVKDPHGAPVWTPRVGGGPGEVLRSEHELLMGLPVEIRDGTEGFLIENAKARELP